MVPAGNKAKSLLLVNLTTKTIQHHHHHSANQLTGFYMRPTRVFNELSKLSNSCYKVLLIHGFQIAKGLEMFLTKLASYRSVL